MEDLFIYSASFLFVALAAYFIGKIFSRFGLPYITGYLLAGMVAGPFILELLPEDTSNQLRYIDEISLAVIAFVAGSELYLKEIRSRLRTIGLTAGGVMVIGLVMIGLVLFILTQFISFADGLTMPGRVATALLGGTILLALSPASTIAVIKEVRAKGTFTKTTLGVTVSMDVVIIILFAVSVAVASALLTGMGFDGTFILLLLIDLGVAVMAGYGTGKLLQLILASNISKGIKIGLVLLIGYVIFAAGYWVIEFTHDNLPFEVHIEPLLVAMIGGFMVTNFTSFREQFDGILHDVGPAVYVAFFTLTGVTLKLDILLATLPIALALFLVRMLAIFIGAYLGGRIAGEPQSFQRYAWLGLITQAGIALGLAREVAVEFPILGDSFATLIISVVVLNEIFGPMFLKFALRRVGEATIPEPKTQDEVRDVVILGIEEQSIELARQLKANNWRVILADVDETHVTRVSGNGLATLHIPEISEAVIARLVPPTANIDAAVLLLEDDELNLKACEIAYERFGVSRLVVRVNDLTKAERFTEMGALVVDQTSAMVNLLDQSVRAPQSTALLLHQDSGRDLVQVTVSNPDVSGMLVRDLRLPQDVLLLDVMREGQSIVPNGYTRLNLWDEITLVGRAESLEDATLKLGF